MKMTRGVFSIGWVLLYGMTALSSAGMAAEKLRYGVAVQAAPYVMPLLAADEKGFWKQNGLEVSWVAFQGSRLFNTAFLKGDVDMGALTMTISIIAASQGIPQVNVARLTRLEFYIWVRANSLILKPEHLKGAKIGITRLGDVTHAYARVAVRALGLEKDVSFVATGGIREAIAALTTGRIQARVGGAPETISLLIRGQLRPLVSVDQFFPKEWAENVIIAPRSLIDKNPELVKRVVRSVLQGREFVIQNRQWSLKQIAEVFRYSLEEASAVFDLLLRSFAWDPKLSREAVENVRNLLIEYKLIDEKKAPPVDELFTTRFVE